MGTTDITGILASIDHAVQDWDVSGDAMRWAPSPSTVMVTFLTDRGDVAVFSDVRGDPLDRIQPGTRVWFNQELYIVQNRLDLDGRVVIDLGEPGS